MEKKRRKSLREMKGERRKENEKKSHSEHKESCICDELKNQHTTHTHGIYIPRDCSLKRRNRMKRREERKKKLRKMEQANENRMKHSYSTAHTPHIPYM